MNMVLLSQNEQLFLLTALLKVKGQFEISNGVCTYYDFIRREGLSLAIWQLFDIVQSAFGENINMII